MRPPPPPAPPPPTSRNRDEADELSSAEAASSLQVPWASNPLLLVRPSSRFSLAPPLSPGSRNAGDRARDLADFLQQGGWCCGVGVGSGQGFGRARVLILSPWLDWISVLLRVLWVLCAVAVRMVCMIVVDDGSVGEFMDVEVLLRCIPLSPLRCFLVVIFVA
jgi:hypothetical protein